VAFNIPGKVSQTTRRFGPASTLVYNSIPGGVATSKLLGIALALTSFSIWTLILKLYIIVVLKSEQSRRCKIMEVNCRTRDHQETLLMLLLRGIDMQCDYPKIATYQRLRTTLLLAVVQN
jgi:hypothetical protein